jgi:hypothetical protein
MGKRIDWSKRLTHAILEGLNHSRENPSRYTSEGYLKPLCAPDEHKPFGKSTRCEICGLVVRGDGANLPPAVGEH